jgi:outer membrane protein, multidrug efflux system
MPEQEMKKSLFFLLCLTSCTLYPPYHRPDFESSDAWRTPLSTKDAVDIGWWRQFGDEVLNNLIDEALANNQNLKVAIARVDDFQAQLGIARSQLYPQIELDGVGDRHKNSRNNTSPPSTGKQIFNAFNFLFNASYLVDLWGQVRSAVEASYHEWLASIEARRVVVLTLITSVANTYVQLRQFDQQLVIAQKTVQDRNRYYYLAKVRFDLGLTSEMPVEQARTEIEIAQADVENFQIAIALAENLLSTLIGKPSMTIDRGTALDALAMPPSVPTYIPSDIVNQRPDLRAAEQHLMAAGAKIGVARSLFFPQISLTGNLGYESIQLNTLLNNSSKIWEYGATVLQEIFTGGRLTSNLQLTQAQQRESLHTYLSTLLSAFQDVNDALVSHKINLEIVETQRKRMEATQKYLYFSNLLYQEGETDYLTFLDAERQYYQSELDYETAKGNSFLTLIQIYQALGGSWVRDADATAIGQN